MLAPATMREELITKMLDHPVHRHREWVAPHRTLRGFAKHVARGLFGRVKRNAWLFWEGSAGGNEIHILRLQAKPHFGGVMELGAEGK